MISPVFEYDCLVLEGHLDTFGHVNNAAYLEIFEEARWDLITRNGYDLAYVQKEKKGPVILEVTMKFQRELRLREHIKITTQLKSYEKLVAVLEQKMINGKGEVACLAHFTFGLFDLNLRRLILPTPEWLAGIGAQT